nr:ABC transporter permease subunit [Ardenticatena sp.]
MRWHYVRTLFIKEWQELARQRMIWMAMLVPLLITLVIPIITVRAIGAEEALDQDTIRLVQRLAIVFPELTTLDPQLQVAVVMLRMFGAMFLLIPVVGALNIATYAIVGEKRNRTLEPVLATPLRPQELLAGKSIGAVAIPMLMTWLGYTLYVFVTVFVLDARLRPYLLDTVSLLMVFVLAPFVALFGLGGGMIVSTRVNDVRAAQQIGGFVVLPVVGLFVGQALGWLIFDTWLVLLMTAGVFLLDVVLLGINVALFDPERILTRWA